MKILNIYPQTTGGGAQKIFKTTHENLKNLDGVDSYIASHETSSNLHLKKSLVGFLNIYKTLSFIKSKEIKSIHFHGGITFGVLFPIFIYFCKKENSAQVVVTLHNYAAICPSQKRFDYKKCEICDKCNSIGLNYIFGSCEEKNSAIKKAAKLVYYNSFRISLRYASKILSPSNFSSQVISKKSKLTISKIYNPVESIAPTLATANIMQKERNEICFIGRLVPEKGLSFLIKTLKTNKPFFNNHKINIVGDGPMRSHIENNLKELNINYECHGFCSPEEIKIILGRCKVIVVPSLWDETFGLVCAEAVAHKCIPVVSDRGALAEITKAISVGVKFECNNTEDFIKAIQKALSDYSSTNWNSALEILSSDFSEQVYVSRVVDIYKQATLEHSPT